MTDTRLVKGRSWKLAVLLFAVTVLPAVTLVWLGWQLLQQDRALLAQRTLERQQATVQGVVFSLEQSLADAEQRIVAGSLPDGMVRLRRTAIGIQAEPADRLLWTPAFFSLASFDDGRFATAERLEFRGAEGEALVAYRDMARSQDLAIRGGALLRSGRVHQRQRRWNEALTAYRSLAELEGVQVAGGPADLQGRRAACAVLERAGRTEDLAREAAILETDLLAGRWQLDGPAWHLTVSDLERWLDRPIVPDENRYAFSVVADSLWNEMSLPDGDEPFRQVIGVRGSELTVLRQRQGGEAFALVIGPAAHDSWIRQATAAVPGAPSVALAGTGGETPANSPGSDAVIATVSNTGLPWALIVGAGSGDPLAEELSGRTRLLGIGLAAVLLLLAGSSYVLWRLVRRELAVARLQTEFVAAVSHEFRTPLTTLRHLTELLDESDDLPRERRATFYRALDRNTQRLQRLVESLLDFARMEGGRQPTDLKPIDVSTLVKDVVADFRSEVQRSDVTINEEIEPGAGLDVRADAGSLTNAVWNLLDNAVKYSPGPAVVHVTAGRSPNGVAISVEDDGLGIPASERPEIFGRFFRGARVPALGIKGTGLGLAMVSHIVTAHGGTIEVESEEGSGSTFTIVLPGAAFQPGLQPGGS